MEHGAFEDVVYHVVSLFADQEFPWLLLLQRIVMVHNKHLVLQE